MNSMKFSDRMDGAEAKTLRILGRYSRIRISILYIQSSRQRASKKGSSKKVLRNCPKNRRNRAKFGDLKKHQFWRGFCRILSAPDIKNREKPRKTGFFRVPRCSIRFHSVLRDYHKSASGVSDSKSVWEQSHKGSNPFLSAKKGLEFQVLLFFEDCSNFISTLYCIFQRNVIK